MFKNLWIHYSSSFFFFFENSIASLVSESESLVYSLHSFEEERESKGEV